MRFDITKETHKDYGETRIVKRFALLPRIVWFNWRKYLIWLECYYQKEEYRYDYFCASNGWYIQSTYPILSETTQFYLEQQDEYNKNTPRDRRNNI